MIIDDTLDKIVSRKIVADEKAERENHVSSGKLSASSLGAPLQWQILKAYRVPQKSNDQYTLRKFLRGRHVERWYLDVIKECVIEEAKKCEYRNVVGIEDAFVDTTTWSFDKGSIPLEVKSTNKRKYDYVTKRNEPDRGHALQVTLYGLARGSSYTALSYINSDDYRLRTFILQVEQYAEQVEAIIDRFERQIKTGVVPVFEPEEKWQADSKYNNYPEWANLNEEQLAEKLQLHLDQLKQSTK